jgi:hypothetical protein
MVHDNDPVDFVLFTGDFTQAGLTSENLTNGVQETINRTHAELKAALPSGTKVYGSVGNHDSWPGDVFPYPCHETCKGSYQVMADAWDLDQAARETVLDGGYYSQRAAPGLMIIAPNTMYWTTINPHIKDSSDPAYTFGFKQMDWFGQQLDIAATKGDAVWVLGHVPGDAWVPELSAAYQQHITKHAQIVKGQFYGHDHQDGIKLTRACDKGNSTECLGAPTGVMWAGPSLTEGWPSENPAIRLMEYDTGSFEFTAAKTYSTDLETANRKGEVAWAFEYDTAEAFGLPDLSPASWEAWVQKKVTVKSLLK